MARVYVSIGSNIDRSRNIRAAVAALRARFGRLDISSVYESEAVGFAGDNFYNLVVGFDTQEPVRAVVAALQAIEDANGRVRSGPRFSSRTLDLDILLYDDLVSDDAELDVPREEITQHAFVLLPLAEIAGDRSHPVSGRRYRDLWAEFEQGGQALWAVDLPLDEPAAEEPPAGNA